ncbi:MAG: oligopeptide transporter, OPT family [Planctomycetes bacterium]|nr:oligopeptide transporter, OPT family [Planctomycetota bacterium]
MNSEGKSLAEITVKAVVLGIVLSVVLAAANAYLGLFAGMTVSASIPAAVVSMGVLRLFRRSNILENNIVQTAASAGESLAAGVIFTLPALVILGTWESFSFKWVAIIAGFGGILGVLFTIPLRRSLIVEGKLKFPEGIATAEILETGQKGGKGVLLIAKAAIASGLFKIGAGGLGLWLEIVEGAKGIGSSIVYFGSNLSPALLSVGYIVGLNIAVLIFIGGAANWCAAIPVVAGQNEWPVYELKSEANDPNAWNAFTEEYKTPAENASAQEIAEVESYNAAVKDKLGQPVEAGKYAHTIWSEKTRYIGVGGMLIGGLWTIFHLRKSLLSGITSGLKAYRDLSGGGVEIPRTEKDMPMKWILVLIIGSVVPLFLLYQVFVQQITVSIMMAVIMLVTGFVFSAVAGYMAGLVGSSNNPISGVTIATVLVSSLLLLWLMGKDAPNGPAAAIIIGSVVCCAAAIAGDNMQDLKAGYIVGATPWKQQVMQLVGTVSAALVLAPVMILLQKAYGFEGQAGAGPKALAAPQANLMASVASGVFKGVLPWNYICIGMAVAVGVIALDVYLQKRGSSFRTPVLAVAIGFYLPFKLSVPIFAGGLIQYAVKRYHTKKNTAKEQVEESGRNGLLFASGLITGEALMGILLAVPIILLKGIDVELPYWYIDDVVVKLLSVFGISLPFKPPVGAVLGIALLLGVVYWLYCTARGRQEE